MKEKSEGLGTTDGQEEQFLRVLALVTINENEPLALARYLEATMPLLEAASARIVQRFALSETIVGKSPLKTMIVVEYPDRAAVDQVFNSAEYQAIVEIRDRAFLEYHVSVLSS